MTRLRIFTLLAVLLAAPAAQASDGAALYASHCAICHDHPEDRTPSRAAMARMRSDEIVAASTQGVMRGQSEGLDATDLRAIAAYLAPADKAAAVAPTGACTTPAPPINLAGATWRGWGNGLTNPRFQPAPGVAAEDVARLKVKWVYRFDASMAVGQPVLVDGWVFTGTQAGRVVALDAATGCTRWTRQSGAPTRTAITLGLLPPGSPARIAAYFADDGGYAHAVNAETGVPLWSRRLDSHVATRITGAPLLHNGRLYVPVSSAEEGWAQKPSYPCCSFRGSVVALDATTGAVIWQTYTIPEAPHPYRRNPANTQQFGPAGAAVWAAPSLDEKRALLYVGTGNSYTDVPERSSDGIVAFDLQTGEIRWTNQIQPHDNYVMPCTRASMAGKGNCPEDLGPDFDFGSSPVLTRLAGGREILLAGQKSGSLFGLDPDASGRKLWEAKLGAGSALGGIQWGFAVDTATAYVAIADPYRRENGPAPKPGLYAVRIADGVVLWQWAAPSGNCAWAGRCIAANSAAVTAIPGVVFAGASDGHLRAHRMSDGAVLWDFDSAARPYPAVNGGSARGGSIDNGGAVVAGGLVLVNSGYGRQLDHAGNALFAFSVDAR